MWLSGELLDIVDEEVRVSDVEELLDDGMEVGLGALTHDERRLEGILLFLADSL